SPNIKFSSRTNVKGEGRSNHRALSCDSKDCDSSADEFSASESFVESYGRDPFAAEIKIIQGGSEHGVDQKIHDFLLRLPGGKSKGGTQGLNRRPPSALADIGAAQIEIGLGILGILSGCVLQVRDSLAETSLIKQRQSSIKTIVRRVESAKRRAGTRRGHDEG